MMATAAEKAAHVAMLRLTPLLIVGLFAFSASSCVAVSTYLAGMEDAENYTWEPIPGTTHKRTWAQDIKDCEAPGAQVGSAGAGAPTGAPTIARSEDAPVVATCMTEKGYRKLYQARSNLF
jgi:hypothetical protein